MSVIEEDVTDEGADVVTLGATIEVAVKLTIEPAVYAEHVIFGNVPLDAVHATIR